MMRRLPLGCFTAVLIAGSAAVLIPARSETAQPSPKISRKSSQSCARKVQKLEDFAAKKQPRGRQTIRFSEEEVNSFLAYDLSSDYHPCLKSLVFKMEGGPVQASALIDFDQLAMASKQFLTRLIAGMFRGQHTLTMRGKIIAQEGKAHFELERAVFDETGLPNVLVEEIISTVGNRQKPPFDPLQPSEMPYGIEKVVFYQGYIVVHQ